MEIRRKVRLGIQSVHGIWMRCLTAVVSGAAGSRCTPAESPDLQTLMILGSCSHFTAGLRYTRVWCGALNDVCSASIGMKLCGQWWWKMQWVDNPCPCPKFVLGRPNLSHPGAPLYAAVNPSRPLSCPGCPKYSTAEPAAQLLAENSPKSHLQDYSVWCGQDVMVQMKPHSQTHAVSIKDLQMFAQSQVLLDLPCQNWQPNQVPILLSLIIHQPSGTHPNSS